MRAECITMTPRDALKSVSREYRARKKGCYLLQDKNRKYLIVAQKLRAIASFLNSVVADDAASRVSVTALHEIVDSPTDNRVGGYSKHRWKLRFAPLEHVADLFESERDRFEHALILGPPACYKIEHA